jgi:hypothetical protein
MGNFGNANFGLFGGGSSGGGGGVVTTVGGVAPISSSGGTTPDISISQANVSTNGFLSSGDWSTFNSKVGGSGTTNKLPKWASASTLGDSQITDNGTVVQINTWLQFEINASGYSGYGRIYNHGCLILKFRSTHPSS